MNPSLCWKALLLFLLACLFGGCGSQTATQMTQVRVAGEMAAFNAVGTPDPPYPEDAFKKGIEGKVTMSVVVDTQGRVSQADALNGPSELTDAALNTVKSWQLEPPAAVPVARTVEMSFGVDKRCSGPESDSGLVQASGRLTDETGKLRVTYDDDYPNPLPRYPEEERRAGVAGKMILIVTVNRRGQPDDVRVLNSLSPRLDQEAIDAVRTWRFKSIDPSAPLPLKDLRLSFIFRATCFPRF